MLTSSPCAGCIQRADYILRHISQEEQSQTKGTCQLIPHFINLQCSAVQCHAVQWVAGIIIVVVVVVVVVMVKWANAKMG